MLLRSGRGLSPGPNHISLVFPGKAKPGLGSDDVQERSWGKRSSFDSSAANFQVTFCPEYAAMRPEPGEELSRELDNTFFGEIDVYAVE